ncbi:MOSC domain-containing protein [Bacillus safensis]|uniref:MOSC domain-containing protein n=1 Tax=Bacillus safensis TaxID=561879 RepID=UPI00227DD0F4|nr:MOSC domain-containing protein [Bacillus safensis]MCY7710959.1 MOSC domain-containing protein [Bacillus safensis]MCY7727652.1 MOSC domain-containing protein [Bacillus safensis]MED0884731.1 MOSC domain-containing protein [Bacillus safensis]MED0916293.1 MOSC domain-containing protein [Bacillus safensis]
MGQKRYAIEGIQVGQPIITYANGKEIKTAINKKRIHEPVYLSQINFEGDGQGDLIHHGGYDKAVCVFPYDHYAHFEQFLGVPLQEAAFGENVTVRQLVETNVHIGDVFQLGDAFVEVSQPRQPCVKLSVKHGNMKIVKEVQKTGYTGFYLRVLKEGMVPPDASLLLVEKASHQITVHEVNEVKYRQTSPERLKAVLEVDALADVVRKSLEKRIQHI